LSGNLDLVRSIYADWERGNFSLAEWADPEIEYTNDDLAVFLRRSWKGLAAIAEEARSGIEIFADLGIQAEEYRKLDDRRVFVLDRASRPLKHGRVVDGSASAQLSEINDGKVTQLVNYWDRDRALADLGLKA
jgi:hypothetical protein